MVRLPQPGGDNGNWGQILNEYLSQAHTPSGTLKDNSVGASQLQAGAVTNSQIADATLGADKLNPAVQASLAKADSALQQSAADARYVRTVNGLTPGSDGNITIAPNQTTPTASCLYNWKPSNTRRVQRSLTATLNGTGLAQHLIVGDSASSPYTGAAFDFPNSWWRSLKRRLVQAGFPDGGTGWVAPCDANDGFDPRIVYAGGWGLNVTYSNSQAANATATFTSDVAGTIAEMSYSGGSAAFTVSIDGGAAVTVTPSGSPGSIHVYSVSGLSHTTHTMVVTASAANAYVLGFRVRNTSGLSFDNIGVKYGISAAGWYADTSQVAVRTLTTNLTTSDPDVLHIALGANDLASSATVGTTITAMTNIRNLYPNADAILHLEAQHPAATAWPDFAEAMYALADTLDCPLVDMFQRVGDTTTALASGLIGQDNVHPTAVFQRDWGALVFDGIMSVGPRPE